MSLISKIAKRHAIALAYSVLRAELQKQGLASDYPGITKLNIYELPFYYQALKEYSDNIKEMEDYCEQKYNKKQA